MHPLIAWFAAAAYAAATAVGAAAPPSAATMAARHVEAIGGFTRVNAVRSLTFNGVYHEAGVALKASQTFMRPFYVLADPHLQPVFLEGFDGRPWEYYGEYGVVLRTAGDPAMATTHASEFDDSLVGYKAKGTRIALAGEITILGSPAFDVMATLKDGFAKHIYVDERTYLIVGSRQTAKLHAFGARITSQTLIGGYRRVAGVLEATTYREVDISSGRELHSMKWTSVEANMALPFAMFSPPRFARSPLSALLEDLYAHRTDAKYDVGAYHAFRSHRPSEGTEAGIEFIGYQILKTGVSASAVGLLAVNARDYPHSADAQFGLGRAYRTAGDETRARAAFRAALRLGPKDARALQALQQH